ncbi:MAG TPA: prolyl aminopeptidase [Kofleriaceae bacterium]|nr:prolyl aminopeptidase [Kofleriaceae bacterium]
MTSMRDLYPPIEPFATGRLAVSPLHTIYFEQVGTAGALPALFLHGGPGGGLDPAYRRYFDPARWHLTLFDQRGSGQSSPYAELRENTTWDLVDDIERLRQHLGLERWLVFGGSWGSTLALAYAQAHPDRVTGLVLRGIFLLRRKELLWFYQEGASWLFRDAWEQFLLPIPEVERGDLMSAYHRRLTSDDPIERAAAARAWSIWEGSTSRLHVDPDYIERYGEDRFAEAFARIEAHYFVHGGFLRTDSQLLDDAVRIADVPGIIVQGRYDVVCPMASAWELHRRWPASRLVVVPDAGHSIKEPGIVSALVEATDAFADRFAAQQG